MNKFIFFTLFIFFFIYFNNLVSNENSPIDIKWVAYNCNSCHLPNAKTDNIIPSVNSSVQVTIVGKRITDKIVCVAKMTQLIC